MFSAICLDLASHQVPPTENANKKKKEPGNFEWPASRLFEHGDHDDQDPYAFIVFLAMLIRFPMSTYGF